MIDPSAAAWLARFGDDADDALNDLLLGQVWLGGYAAAEVPQALPQFFPIAQEGQLDTALQCWLASQRRREALPEGVTAKQFAQALADAFTLLQSMSLPRCLGWCRGQARALWAWLQTQPSYASREPRAAFLRALALQQPNRDLLQFWISLCRQGQRAWTHLALFGLRRMPCSDDGTPETSLPLALVNGLIDFGLTLARGRDVSSQKKQWLAELDFLSAVYPMSRDQWASRLREALGVRSKTDALNTLRRWVDERHPAANQAAPVRAGRKPLRSPHWNDDIRPLLERFDHEPAAVRPALQAQMDRHLRYAQESGDTYSLVLSHHQLARFLLQPARPAPNSSLSARFRDPAWALALGQLSAAWAPGNPHSWSVVAAALDAVDDWSRARAVFWFARRRFPYSVFAHTQLGHALAMHGQMEEGEAVFRAAIRRFPDNPVVWSDLAHTLRVAERRDESLAVYRQAQGRFRRHPPIATGLTAVLIDLGQAEAARDALDWAEHVCGDQGDKDQRVLHDLRRRYTALVSGQPMQLKRLKPRRDAAAGDWVTLESAAGTNLRGLDALGESTLWRQRASLASSSQADQDLQRAHHALRAAAEPLAQDVRWQVEHGLWLAAHDGEAVASQYFDQLVAHRPGDGVLTMLQLASHARLGARVDWQGLRSRFSDLAPLLRVADNPQAKRPTELDVALAAVTAEGGEPQLDLLDDDQRQALRIYETAGEPELAELVQQDFLVSLQLSVI